MVLPGDGDPDLPQGGLCLRDRTDGPAVDHPLRCEKFKIRPRLLQLCGTEDFLYENNQRFRSAAEEAGYGHVYMEAPGEHAWPYWDRAIQQAIRFFLGLSLLDMIYY